MLKRYGRARTTRVNREVRGTPRPRASLSDAQTDALLVMVSPFIEQPRLVA